MLVALAAALVLAWFAPLFRPNQLHVVTLYDQVGYVTSARWLADHGELRSHLIYPAYAEKESWRLYMPGYYWLLAGTFEALDYGPLQARLPGLVCYVLSGVLVFLLGRRLYGERAAFLAAGLYLLFPPNVAFAYAVMSEVPFGCAALAALCAFVHLPPGRRYAALPLLIVVPFLFRETAVLLLVPALLLHGGRRLAPALALLGSVLTLGAVFLWQAAAGRQPPPISWIARREFNLGDVTIVRDPPSYTAQEWLTGFATNVQRNFGLIAERWQGEFLTSWPVFTAVILVLSGTALVLGLKRNGRRDRYALGVGLLAAGSLAVLLVLHRAVHVVVLRHMLPVVPFAAVAVAPALVRLLGAGAGARVRTVVAVLLLAVLAQLGSGVLADEIVVDEPPQDTLLLEESGHDDTRLLVSAPTQGLDYVLKHYPVRWSFVPDNDETLRALDARHPVGTLILKTTDLGERLSFDVLRELEIEFAGAFRGRNFLTYRKSAPPR